MEPLSINATRGGPLIYVCVELKGLKITLFPMVPSLQRLKPPENTPPPPPGGSWSRYLGEVYGASEVELKRFLPPPRDYSYRAWRIMPSTMFWSALSPQICSQKHNLSIAAELQFFIFQLRTRSRKNVRGCWFSSCSAAWKIA